MKQYNYLNSTDKKDVSSISILEMAAAKPKKDVAMRPRCVVDCKCARGGRDLRSQIRTTPQ
jgi:hypothetical protein